MKRFTQFTAILLTMFLFAGDVHVSGQDQAQFQGLSGEQIELLKRRVSGTIREQGVLESADVVEIKSPVPGESTILSIIPEGTEVQQGDLLIQLDDSDLKEQLQQTQIEYETIQALVESLSAKLKSQREQAGLEIEVAELKLKTAQLAQERYVDGELPAELDQADRLLKFASMRREMLQRAAQSPQTPEAQRGQLPGAIIELETEIERLETQKQLLTDFKSPHQKAVLELAIAESNAQLRRIQRVTDNEALEIEATLKAEEAKLKAVKQKLETTERQIAACRMFAPRDGVVMHAAPAVRRSNASSMEVGSSVREQQLLLTIPDFDHLRIKVRVDQSQIRRVRAEQSATIRIDGFPNQQLTGHVTRINRAPETATWPNTDRVEYGVLVELDNIPEGAMLGMTALVEINVESE